MKRTNGRALVLSCLVILSLAAITLIANRQGVKAKQPNSNQPSERFVPGRVLVKFQEHILPAQARNIIAALGARDADEIPNIGVHILDLPDQANEKAFVERFKGQSEVEFAELDRIVEPSDVVPNDPFYLNWEWHLTKISAPTAWSTTTGSSAVTIAILDMGVAGDHEDLVARMVPGWNVYDNNSNTSDIGGHGTQVAGTAAATSNNGMGVASVCWSCKIMPIRISAPDGSASYTSIAAGLNWAADHGARVANISYAPLNNSSTVTSAAKYFRSKGGVVTVAAGNEGTFDSSADNPSILVVTATNVYDQLYAWSNTGNDIDLSAPGNVYTVNYQGGYMPAAGSSFSAPIVAGVAGLLFSANPALTPAQLDSILKNSADDLGSAGWDSNYGWGRVNAARAVAMAGTGGPSDTTSPTVSFSAPTDGATVLGTVSIALTANDNVGVTSVSLNLDGLLIGTDTSSPYSFTWNTTNALNGSHTLTATASDAAGNITSASAVVMVNNVVDSVAPTVSITSPANGATVSTNASVYVTASDNAAVMKVELYVDGALTATSTSAPFTTKWNTRKAAAGAHSLQCKAYDAAGNVGNSQISTVYK